MREVEGERSVIEKRIPLLAFYKYISIRNSSIAIASKENATLRFPQPPRSQKRECFQAPPTPTDEPSKRHLRKIHISPPHIHQPMIKPCHLRTRNVRHARHAVQASSHSRPRTCAAMILASSSPSFPIPGGNANSMRPGCSVGYGVIACMRICGVVESLKTLHDVALCVVSITPEKLVVCVCITPSLPKNAQAGGLGA
jgi:hypothetical protein